MVTSSVWGVLLCLLFTSVSFAGSDPVLDRANGKSLSIEKDAICLPVGSKAFAKRDVGRKQYEYRLQSVLKLGPMVIPKGCNLSLGYGTETTGRETDKELEEIRYVRVISECPTPFLVGDTKFLIAVFNSEGCLDGMQSLGEVKKLCGRSLNPRQPIYFDSGFLDCTGRKEKEESRL